MDNSKSKINQLLGKKYVAITGYECPKCKSPEEYLQAICDYYENIIAVLPNNVYWLDQNCILRGCNDNVAKLCNLPREKCVGLDYEQIRTASGLTPEQVASFKRDDMDVISTGKPKVNIEEPYLLNEDGTPLSRYISTRVPMTDKTGKIVGVVGISTDITELKKIEEELRVAKNRAELASEVKSQFIQNMEHDLRTPAAGVYGVLNSIVDTIQDPELKNNMQLVTKGSKRLLDFLNDIISFDKYVNGQLPLVAHEFDLWDVLNSIVEMELPRVKEKNIELKLDIAKDLPQHIINDQHRIFRIILNLVSNAVKFTKEGQVIISASIKKQIDSRHCLLKLVVKDTGIGIPPDKIHRIYERFERCTPSNKGLYPGAGLGLSITRQFIDELQGDVSVESKEGEGTTFTCIIPCKIPLVGMQNYESIFNAMPTEAKPEKEKAYATVFTKESEIELKPDEGNKPIEKTAIAATTLLLQKGTKILLVEDDQMAQILASNVLKNLRLDYDLAETGREALDLWNKNKYGFILMDLGLPDIKGDQVTKQIRETDKNTIIIALTAHHEDKIKKLCKKAGMQGFMTKPINGEKILETLRDIQNAEEKAVEEIPLVEPEVTVDDEKKIFDIAICRKNARNNEDLVKKLMSVFAKKLPEYIKEFEGYYNDKNIKYLGLLAHKLKGAAVTVGAPKLSAVTGDLQNIAEVKKITMEDVEEYYNAVCAEILEAAKLLKKMGYE